MTTIIRHIHKNTVVRYIFVGGSTFILDISTLVLLHDVLSVNLPIATSIAFIVALIYNFIMARAWTFNNTQLHGLHKHFILYMLLIGFNYVVTVSFVTIASHVINFTLAKTTIAILQIGWNYLAYKYIIFKKPTAS